MQIKKWATAEVPPLERFGQWSEVLNKTHFEWQLLGAPKDFYADVTRRDIGGLRIVGCRCDPCEGFRGLKEINFSEERYVGVLFDLAGREIMRQGDREEIVGPGDFVVWSSHREMEFRVLEPLHKLTIIAPYSMMRRFLPDVDDLTGMRVSAMDSLAPLVGAYLRQLSEGIDVLEDQHLQLILNTTLELVAAGVHARYPRDEELKAEPFDRVQRFILSNLDDPLLSPRAVADGSSISLRYLHKLFAKRGLSVSRWIQQQRLEQCRRELLATGSSSSITDIAFRWGFNDTSHFSRCFRSEFGVAPRVFRKVNAQAG